MKSHSVEKIGGTSMSRTDALLDNVLIGVRKGADLSNRIFVVSAYGGMTDLLLEHKKSGEHGVYSLFASAESGWSWGDALSRVGERMIEKNADIFTDPTALATADAFIRERIEGVRSCLIDLQRLCSYGHFQLEHHLLTVREMLAALGEAHSAHNTALLLRQHGVKARFVDLTGWRDETQRGLDDQILHAFAEIDVALELPIVTGYAQCLPPLMQTYDRGYSEVTLSRLAVVTEALEAIIHK
jgi:aspartate kinase